MSSHARNHRRITSDCEADSSPVAPKNRSACRAGNRPRRVHLRHSSGISESKYNDAATLAIDLASARPWSDTLLPPASSTSRISDRDSTNTQMKDYSQSHVTGDITDLGPPPEYSSSTEHDLTVESDDSETEDTHLSPAQSEMAERTCSGYDVPQAHRQQESSEPLLGELSEKQRQPRYAWMRTNVAGTSRKRRWGICIVACLVMVSVVGSLLGTLLIKRNTPKTYPRIPTDLVHVQHETYDDIRGHFELYDKLELTTTTGNIDIQIDLQAGNNTAELILKSSTGSISLGIADSWWQRRHRSERPIRTEIKTVTGNIWGRILLENGGYASVDSVSGKQDLRVYVYSVGPDAEICELITRSSIGDQVVGVVNFGGFATIDNFKAQHHSTGTANLDLGYSHSWRGQVHAVTSPVGKLDVQRDGHLVFDKNTKHEVLAHKGDESQRNEVNVVSEGTGSVCFKAWYTW